MTLQEAFNISWEHFVTNYGPPSLSEEKGCMYRGPHGEKCAIGLLIPDKEYDPNMEYEPPVEVIEQLNLGIDVWILRELQMCHDNATRDGGDFYTGIKAGLESFARTYNLVTP